MAALDVFEGCLRMDLPGVLVVAMLECVVYMCVYEQVPNAGMSYASSYQHYGSLHFPDELSFMTECWLAAV